MATTFKVTSVKRTGNAFPGIGGVWEVQATKTSGDEIPPVYTKDVDSQVYANDGVLLRVTSVDGDKITATVPASALSLAVSPGSWSTLSFGKDAQPKPEPSIARSVYEVAESIDKIPAWVKIAGAIGVVAGGYAIVKDKDKE